ncbi:hypothetical protein O0L34_g14841 [Tuta absoluta]|nr:hypothetical protein O0L34_g14841 [Tuta absoluta]
MASNIKTVPADGIVDKNPSNPQNSKIYLIEGTPSGADTPSEPKVYKVYKYRFVILSFFVLYSASNSLQWTQYTIISDIVKKYYGVKETFVTWTSLVYMVFYIPLIFPASFLLDKTVSL